MGLTFETIWLPEPYSNHGNDYSINSIPQAPRLYLIAYRFYPMVKPCKNAYPDTRD